MAQCLLDCLQSSLSVKEKFMTVNILSKQLTHSQVDEILDTLKATSNYDKVRIDIANRFKRPSCVLDILENGDKQSIAKAVKFPWMYVEGSDLVNAEFLMTFFPKISYSTRLKIINNLGRHLRNPQTADYIFNVIECKYGFPVACGMLQACSEEVVIDLLVGKRHYKLYPTQLLAIVKRSHQEGLNYFKQLYEDVQYINEDFSSSLKYLLNHHTDETVSFLCKYPDKWNICLGRKLSKRILQSHKEEVVKLVSKKRIFLKPNQVRKYLSLQQYEEAFLNPSSDLRNILQGGYRHTELWQWLDFLPKSRQLLLLRCAFKTAFNKEIAACPQHVSPEMIVLLPEEERSIIINWKVESESNDFIYCQKLKHVYGIYSSLDRFWTAMKASKESITELTKILNFERDAKKRADVFMFLVVSCIFYKNAESLIEILKLLTKKCRNDVPEVRASYLQAMNEAADHIEFQEEHWACFQELLQFLQLYKEMECNATYIVNLLGMYASYHQKHGKSFDAELHLIAKMTGKCGLIFDISHVRNPENKRELLLGYVKAFSNIEVSALWSEHSAYFLSVIEEISKWNQQHGSKFGLINGASYPWLEEQCWEMMNKQKIEDTTIDTNKRIIAFKILKVSSSFTAGSVDKILKKTICVPVLDLCLKVCPEKIAGNMENIVANILKLDHRLDFHSYFTFVRKLRGTYSWELMNEFKEECKKVLNHEGPQSVVTEIGNAVCLLAILERPSEFLNFASKYYPVEAKIDTSLPIDEVDYRIKESISKSLKYVRDARASLPVVDKYLVGDYLKLASTSLYSVCCAVPETVALAYLQPQLKNRPVSVKKHMIRLFFTISPLDDKCKILEGMWSIGKNPSIRYEVLVQAYNLIKSIPREEVWKLLKSFINSLTKDDAPCLDFVKHSQSIDLILGDFTSDFFQTILEQFKGIGVYKNSETDVINRIADLVSILNGNFLDCLLRDVLYNTRICTLYVHGQLAVKYLMDDSISDQVRMDRLNLIQEIVEDLFHNYWDVKELTQGNEEQVIFPTRRMLTCICQGICDFLLNCRGENKDVDGKEILQRLIKQFKDIPHISKVFKNLIYVQFTLVAISTMGLEDFDWLKQFGCEVAYLVSYYPEKYGGEVTCVVSTILKEISDKMLPAIGNENILRVIEGLLNGGIDKYHLITAISLLPKNYQHSAELLEIYERVVSVIKSSQDESVEIFMKLQENDTEDQIQVFNI